METKVVKFEIGKILAIVTVVLVLVVSATYFISSTYFTGDISKSTLDSKIVLQDLIRSAENGSYDDTTKVVTQYSLDDSIMKAYEHDAKYYVDYLKSYGHLFPADYGTWKFAFQGKDNDPEWPIPFYLESLYKFHLAEFADR